MRDRILSVILLLAVIVLAWFAFKSWQHRDRASWLWYYSDHQIATIVLYGGDGATRCSAGVSPYRIKAKGGHVVVWEILDACRVPAGEGGRRVTVTNFRRDGTPVKDEDLFELLPSSERAIVRRVRPVGRTVHQYSVFVDGVAVASGEFEECPDWPCGR